MKKSALLRLALLLVLPLSVQAAGNNWMASADGNLFVSQLSIPGTHDSAALSEPFPGTAKCQSNSLAQQLADGVRYLDIRLHYNSGTSLNTQHGIVNEGQSFDTVLTGAVLPFLTSNPTECVIMSIKEENSSAGAQFADAINYYINQYSPSMWAPSVTTIPTLNSVRGKIIILRRFGAQTNGATVGINAQGWSDNTTFTTSIGSGESLTIQDNYNVSSNDTKWSQITSQFTSAFYGNPDTLFLNYTSGVASILGVPNITSVSNDIDSRLTSYLGSNLSGRRGVVVMDFETSALCSLIYNPAFLWYDAENLAVQASSGDTYRTITDPAFSGNEGTILDANAAGDYVTLVVPNVTHRTYSVRIGVKKLNTRGIFQLAIGAAGSTTPTNLGTPQDLYSSAAQFVELNLGNWTPSSSSDKWFRFTITGKNASSTGFNECLDYILLIPQ